jgi:Bacterial extracellular solute-binding proteins, family 3
MSVGAASPPGEFPLWRQRAAGARLPGWPRLGDHRRRMRRRHRHRAGVALALALLLPAAGLADGAMTYVYHAPESERDVRYEYHWEILRTALERTKARWGPYRMAPSERMSERRQAYEMERASGKLTVMYLSTIPEFEQRLVPVRIPVDKDLGGYCVFLIRKEDRHRFESVRTIEDLRRFKIGLGYGWIDVDILRASGFDVVTGTSYDGLFEMLLQRRFDVFLRAATEVLDEREQRKESLPDLFIEESIVFHYPLPMYFWFPRTPEGKRLAARAEEGMRAMIADGTYDAIFDKHQRHKILQLGLRQRRLLRIPNPYAGPETPYADKRLWFDPATYR